MLIPSRLLTNNSEAATDLEGMIIKTNRFWPILTIVWLCLLLSATQPPVSAESPLKNSAENSAELPPRFVLGYDFYYYWGAGHGAATNRNVYKKEIFGEEIVSAGRPSNWSYSAWLYPPWGYAFLIPFGLLPFALSKFLWLSISAAVLIISVNSFGSSKLGRLLNGSNSNLISTYLFTLCFPPVIRYFLIGQCSFLMLGGVLLYFSYLLGGKSFKAGLALSLTFIKFHILLPFYAAAVFSRRKKEMIDLLIGMVVGLGLQTGFVLCFYPGAFSDYWNAWVLAGAAKDTIELSTSLAKVGANYFGLPSFQFIPAMVAMVGASVTAMYKPFSARTQILYLIPIAVLTSPYTWVHTSLILLFPYLSSLTHVRAKYGSAVLIPLVGIFLWFLYLFSNAQAEAFAIWIPVGVLGLVLWSDLAINKYFKIRN